MPWRLCLFGLVAAALAVPSAWPVGFHAAGLVQMRDAHRAVPGTLDPSFGRFNGLAETQIAGPGIASVWLDDLALTRAGVVALGTVGYYGSGDSNMVLVRYTTRGRLEPAFGHRGIRLTETGAAGGALAVQGDGKILVGELDYFKIDRFLPNGRPDVGFGKRGSVDLSAVGANEDAGAVRPILVQPSGKIVVFVFWADYQTFTTSGSAVVRINRNGTLDRSFGVNGVARTPFVPDGDSPFGGMVIGPDGTITVAGRSAGQWALVRLSADGTLDPTFGNNGELALPTGVQSLLLWPNGRILVVSTSALTRLTSSGQVDPSFGRNGTVAASKISTAALERNGEIVVGGRTTLVRLRENGSIDPRFGSPHGIKTDRTITAIAIQPDGKILAGSSVGRKLIVARYNG